MIHFIVFFELNFESFLHIETDKGILVGYRSNTPAALDLLNFQANIYIKLNARNSIF